LITMVVECSALGTHIDTSDKVAQDLDLYRSFIVVSDQINQHTDLDFATIGADGLCDFDSTVSSIQDVINTGVTEVRVASNGSYMENIILNNQDLILRGGFTDCAAASANNQVFNEFSTIDGSALPISVIAIGGNGTKRLIRMENLILTGGTSAVPHFGGGLSVDEAEVELQMLRVVIADNTGGLGAGMYIDAGIGVNSTDTDVFAQDLIISNNTSTTLGGGLYCHAGSQMTLTRSSFIGNNHTAGTGGGVVMRNGCNISMYSGSHAEAIGFVSGIINNSSDEEGGGVFMTTSAELFMFGQQMCDDTHCLGSAVTPIYIFGNNSDDDLSGNESGGGIYMEDSAFQNEFYGNGLVMISNQAGGHGGGAFVAANSTIEIERRIGGCWQKDRCNLIIGNQSGTSVGLGGAFYVEGGTMHIGHAYVEENRADFGTAIAAGGESALVTIENSVFDDNGDNGADNFSDFQVINASVGASVAIRHSTFADNDVTVSVFDVDPALDSSMSLFSSVVHDPSSGNLFGAISGDLMVNCVVAHEAASFTGTQVVVGDPMFVNRAEGDFHLAAGSPAVDLCLGIPMFNALDMNMEPRPWDDLGQLDGLGIFDAGADESYLSDVIFKDGFGSI
ncbi:MAG: hypothetical protein ACSHWU_12565, partial [Marinicella sp.]